MSVMLGKHSQYSRVFRTWFCSPAITTPTCIDYHEQFVDYTGPLNGKLFQFLTHVTVASLVILVLIKFCYVFR